VGRVVQYEIPDEIYADLEAMAARKGTSVETEVLQYLADRASARQDNRSEEERDAAHQRFRSLFGSVNLGHPTDLSDEAIEADLAREYGSSHEEDV
jgi:hypothetical protein